MMQRLNEKFHDMEEKEINEADDMLNDLFAIL